MTADTAAITIRSLRKEYPLSTGSLVAVDDLDLDIGPEEFFTIVGPSGCGKTTTLRCIAGLETPTSGTIEFGGTDVTPVPANKRNLAMMFQNIALFPHMTAGENIAYPLKVTDVPREQRDEQVAEAAAVMRISELLEKHPGDLSGGQRQRVALARTLVQDPVAFLMDEPLSDLDAKLKVEIRKEIQRIHKRVAIPAVYVTHDQEEAMTMSDRIAVMNGGRIEQVGTPDELYERPRNRFVAEFIGNPSMNFLDGTVTDAVGDRLAVAVGDDEFRFAADGADVAVDADVTVGFRPEALAVDDGDGSDFERRLLLLERTGERYLATFEDPSGELRANVRSDADLVEEETYRLAVDRSRVYLFDRATGDLLARNEGASSEIGAA